ncbi:caspase-7-like [Mizuhopecten yessoensis]|uniref:Caspase-7 n=1 Tax=Mizuhopecten yessoensis TaxID=6573 RepID=A0A210PWC2_MIZYE|nr:caspase-7-like [Mizuhopecten yessoensis]XP_021373548.1 caspase-7-like [Mizuhopecten yessoensis]OWF40773.1 Caspase-7 [Mizuhopecten yessoensis]
MATRPSSEMRQRHLKLLNALADYFDPKLNQQDYDKLMNSCRAFLSPMAVKNSPKLLDALQNLEKKGTIAVGKYEELKKIVKELDVTLVDIINEAEEDITSLKQQAAASVSVPQLKDDAGPPSSHVTNLNVPSMSAQSGLQHQSVGSTDMPSSPKRRRDDTKDDYTYKDDNKRGLLVILNFTQKRAGTQSDEDELKKFFEGSLHWEVDIRQDLTYTKLDRYLNGLQERLGDRSYASKFYCLMVAIMSHGTEDGIYPHDSKKEVKERQVYEYDRIFNAFKNDEIKAFAGKPKVFLVQACRGSQTQREVTQDDHEPMEDETTELPRVPAAVRIAIPVDADMLIMWATTPGFKAFRDVFSGSHFLQEVVDQFKQNYGTDHVETMLMKVRHTFARTDKYRREGQAENEEGKWVANVQMPCSWTTLTKMLYLTQYRI